MNLNITDFIFPSDDQLFGNQQLEVLKKYGMKMAVTDFSILLGAFVSNDYYTSEGKQLKDRVGYYFSSSSDGTGAVRAVY